jgi:hypothetical protein
MKSGVRRCASSISVFVFWIGLYGSIREVPVITNERASRYDVRFYLKRIQGWMMRAGFRSWVEIRRPSIIVYCWNRLCMRNARPMSPAMRSLPLMKATCPFSFPDNMSR